MYLTLYEAYILCISVYNICHHKTLELFIMCFDRLYFIMQIKWVQHKSNSRNLQKLIKTICQREDVI